jgi:hypothetical protein
MRQAPQNSSRVGMFLGLPHWVADAANTKVVWHADCLAGSEPFSVPIFRRLPKYRRIVPLVAAPRESKTATLFRHIATVRGVASHMRHWWH